MPPPPTHRPEAIDDRRYTVEEYLALEETSETKHDFFKRPHPQHGRGDNEP